MKEHPSYERTRYDGQALVGIMRGNTHPIWALSPILIVVYDDHVYVEFDYYGCLPGEGVGVYAQIKNWRVCGSLPKLDDVPIVPGKTYRVIDQFGTTEEYDSNAFADLLLGEDNIPFEDE